MTRPLAAVSGRPRLTDRLRRWLGSECAVCRRHQQARICDACIACHAAPAPRCPGCGLRTAAGMSPCRVCRSCATPSALDRTVVATDYAAPWDALVARLKFAGEVDLAPALARLLSRAVAHAEPLTPEEPAPTQVVPVPLAPARLRSRGYNQAALLALPVARDWRLHIHGTALVRLRDTRAQHGLDRATRLRNLHEAFTVPAAARPTLRGCRVALVDDVMTTGATLEAAARALKAAGVAHVQAWVFARTPAPDL